MGLNLNKYNEIPNNKKTLTGKNDPYVKIFFSLASKRSYIEISPNIPTEMIPDFIGNCDAFLFLILWDEPYGLVFMETLSFGTPIIAFHKGSVPELVTEGVNGFVCNNEDEMYNAVLAIKKINRENCRKVVETKQNIEHMYNDYLKFYNLTIQKN